MLASHYARVNTTPQAKRDPKFVSDSGSRRNRVKPTGFRFKDKEKPPSYQGLSGESR